MVTSLTWSPSTQSIRWVGSRGDTAVVVRTPIRAACATASGTRVAVVEGESGTRDSNATVFSEDGIELYRVKAPSELAGFLCFDDVRYVGRELTFILVIPGRDFAVVVNEDDGKVVRWYETR